MGGICISCRNGGGGGGDVSVAEMWGTYQLQKWGYVLQKWEVYVSVAEMVCVAGMGGMYQLQEWSVCVAELGGKYKSGRCTYELFMINLNTCTTLYCSFAHCANNSHEYFHTGDCKQRVSVHDCLT